ncbi:MAG TPA: hypothetical protein VK866_11660 [Acidimicrobiales bacterium]|nr:hypothetical protein [Acidimicrobiales bacterium]
MIARWVGIALGLWLYVAPAVLGYGDPAAVNDRLVGPLIFSISFIALWEVVRPLRWWVVPAGVWMVVAPLVLGYDDTAAIVSSVAVGVATVATAWFGGQTSSTFGGGWSALWGDPVDDRAG